MELCQMCSASDRTNLLTKCCQLFICYDCRDKCEKLSTCSCGKSIGKKWCEPEPKLYQTLHEYYSGQPLQCSRCDESTGLQYCHECEIEFCENCFAEVHSKGEYQKHVAVSKNNVKKILQEKRSNSIRQEICHEHRIKKEYICECSQQPMCSNCLRSHRQNCSKKYRGLADYKKEYFSGMLNKLQQLTDCKSHLKKSCQQYRQHFEEQRKMKDSCEEFIKETFSNIQRLLEFKRAELTRSLEKYWQECTSAYQKNLSGAEAEDKKYDDYAKLIERLADKTIGIDYLDRRISKKTLQCEPFTFRLCGLEAMEKQIMAVVASTKKWEIQRPQEEENAPLRTRKLSSVFENQTPQVLTQIHEDPLHSRPLKLLASATEIQYEFIHLPYQKEEYEIEFGVGMKVKGQEVFKRIRADSNGKGIVSGLNPQTNYRVRMRVINGVWGAISEVTTLQPQNFITSNCSFAKGDNKGTVMFLKSGTLYATNPLQFGVHTWEIKIVVDKNSHSESETACISLGVSNRESKKALFVGTTLNYGYQRENFKVKITVDCGQGRMAISNDKQQEESYQNLPDLPLYPTIINKGNSTVQLNIQFVPAS